MKFVEFEKLALKRKIFCLLAFYGFPQKTENKTGKTLEIFKVETNDVCMLCDGRAKYVRNADISGFETKLQRLARNRLKKVDDEEIRGVLGGFPAWVWVKEKNIANWVEILLDSEIPDYIRQMMYAKLCSI